MREVCHPIGWSLLGLLKKALGLCVKGGGEEEWVLSFTSIFLKEVTKKFGTKLNLSSAYHPHSLMWVVEERWKRRRCDQMSIDLTIWHT